MNCLSFLVTLSVHRSVSHMLAFSPFASGFRLTAPAQTHMTDAVVYMDLLRNRSKDILEKSSQKGKMVVVINAVISEEQVHL